MFVSLILYLFACETATKDTVDVVEPSEPADENTSINEPDEVEISEEYSLEEGKWVYSDVNIEEDGCGLHSDIADQAIQAILDSQYDVRYVAENNYVLTLQTNEEEFPIICIVENNTIQCEELLLAVPAYDSIVFETYLSQGTLSSDTRIEGVFSKTHTCEGPDCQTIEAATGLSFPCTVTFAYTFNFFD